MAAFKITILLCSIILTCYCEESSTKQPVVQNTTSQIEKEGDLKPAIEKPTNEKFARQVVPEFSPNTRSEVRYQGQLTSNPVVNGFPQPEPEPSLNNQNELRPTYLRSLDTDHPHERSSGSLDQRQASNQESNQELATRSLSRVPYYGRPATAVSPGRSEVDQTRRRVQFQDPVALDPDERSYKPYSFNYIAETDEARTSHQQTADNNGRVSGSYSMVLGDGRQRIVEYVADEQGFRANVDTNEPGTSSAQSPANTFFYSSSPKPAIQGPTQRQPQPNLIPPVRDGYRFNDQRRSGPASSPISGSDGRTESHLNGPQFRRGREDVLQIRPVNGNIDQANRNQAQITSQSGSDSSAQSRRLDNNAVQFSSNPALSRRTQNRQSSVLPTPDQIPPSQTYGGENRQGSTQYRPPLNPRPNLTGSNNLQSIPQSDSRNQRQPILHRSSPQAVSENQLNRGQIVSVLSEDNNAPQINGPRPTLRSRGENDASYYGWFRHPVSSGNENVDSNVRALERPIARGSYFEDENASRQPPNIPNLSTRSQQLPAWSRPIARPNVVDPSSNSQILPSSENSPQSHSGRPTLISSIDSNRNIQPDYNRATDVPNSQNFNSRANSNVENTQDIPPGSQRIPPRPITQPVGQNTFQDLPNMRNTNTRDAVFVPETRAVLDEIPPYYRDYGTYWYYGH